MLQRYLARSARTFAAQSFESRLPQASRTSFRVAQSNNARILAGVRSYSDSKEAAKEEAAAGDKAETKEEEEDPLQKELAAAKKEASEASVRRYQAPDWL